MRPCEKEVSVGCQQLPRTHGAKEKDAFSNLSLHNARDNQILTCKKQA